MKRTANTERRIRRLEESRWGNRMEVLCVGNALDCFDAGGYLNNERIYPRIKAELLRQIELGAFPKKTGNSDADVLAKLRALRLLNGRRRPFLFTASDESVL